MNYAMNTFCRGSGRPGALMAAGVVSLVLAAGAAAAEMSAIGTIEGTIDSESWQWETVYFDRDGVASATMFDFGAMSHVTIQGMIAGGSPTEDQLSIEFVVENGQASEPVVSYFPQGMFPHYTSDAAGEASVDILSVTEPSGDGADDGAIEARFDARICRLESMSDEPDAGQCRSIEGTIDTVLYGETL